MNIDITKLRTIVIRTPSPAENKRVLYLTPEERLIALLKASQVKAERVAKERLP